MNKTSKIWLLIAGTTILVGCILFGSVIAALAGDFSALGTQAYLTNRHTVSEPFDSILIDTETADITFLPSEDGACEVVCLESERLTHTVAVQDGVLTIRLVNRQKWYDYIGITTKSPTLTVYLSGGTYQTLRISNDTGDISVPDDFIFASMEIMTDTGDVQNAADTTDTMKIHTSTGDIRLESLSAASLDLATTTGAINLTQVSCTGDVHLRVSTGKTNIRALTCRNLHSTGSTGDLHLASVLVENILSLQRSTGDVSLDGCDAADIQIQCSTGDVIGTLLSDKIYSISTDTGKVSIPDSQVGGKCQITTSTGDIRLEIRP